MKKYNIQDFVRGWFVGDFEPSVIKSKDIEIAIQYYKAGDIEPKHVHKVAREVTAIVFGRVRMSGKEFITGDLIDISPRTATDFFVIEDTATVVVKTPSAPSDKYFLN